MTTAFHAVSRICNGCKTAVRIEAAGHDFGLNAKHETSVWANKIIDYAHVLFLVSALGVKRLQFGVCGFAGSPP